MSKRAAFCLGIMALLVTGCWDANYLINKKMVNGVGIDAGKDGQIKGTLRAVVLQSKGGGQFDVKDEFVQATGDSVAKIGYQIDAMLPGTIEASKTHVFVIGSEMAKRGIMSPLEIFFRSQKGYLQGNLVISEGLASDVISSDITENNPVAFDIMQMILGAERLTNIPVQTLHSMWMKYKEEGEDPILPVIRNAEKKKLIVDSVGLCNRDQFTGIILPRDESILLLLLKDKLDKQAMLNVEIAQQAEFSDEQEARAPVSFEARKIKRIIDVKVNKQTNEMECDIKLDLYGSVSSYPTHLDREIDRSTLNAEMSAILIKRAKAVVAKLQQANCDAFGIGRILRAQENALWRQMDWKKTYPEIHIHPVVQVHITSTGILK